MDQLAAFLKQIKPKFDDDSIDRLNYYYTVVLLLGFTITLSAKQYVGNPLQCWVPAEFKDPWEKYTEDYCYIENTYWVAMYDKIPDDHSVRNVKEINYYQWVPFVLALQALMFHIPHLIWQLMNWQAGLNVRAIVSMACDSQNVKHDEREHSVQTISNHISDACSLQKHFGRESNPVVFVFGCGKAKGLYVTALYIACKLLYVINAIGQLFLLNKFIGSKYTYWGAEIITDLLNGRTWESSGHFPRVTMCDFVIRGLGTTRRYSVQCVLMINMFNEKIYLFLWWWFLIVALATILNLFWWAYCSFSSTSRVSFVDKYIKTARSLAIAEGVPFVYNDDDIKRFTRSKLRPDGVFVLRLVSANAGDIISTEIVKSLWMSYLDERAAEEPNRHMSRSDGGSTGDDSEKRLLS